MSADTLHAAGMVAGSDHGPISTLPRTGEVFNGNTCKVWYERGQLASDSNMHAVRWSRQ
jgi:hypothetical protein